MWKFVCRDNVNLWLESIIKRWDYMWDIFMEWFYFIIWSFSVNNVMVNFFFYRNIYVMYMFVNVYNFD